MNYYCNAQTKQKAFTIKRNNAQCIYYMGMGTTHRYILHIYYRLERKKKQTNKKAAPQTLVTVQNQLLLLLLSMLAVMAMTVIVILSF